MPVLVWSEALALEHARMDATHREFIDRLVAVEAAQDADLPILLGAYDALIEHCVAHFGQEDRWMAATGFAPENCHSRQHSQVLDTLRDVRRFAVDQGKPDLIGQLLAELAHWFEQHAHAADAALAAHLRDVGFDADSGHVEGTVGAIAISTCGSKRCAA
ncbi:MAG: hemerythrin domain-containing protein [Burkholderiales bacterium]